MTQQQSLSHFSLNGVDLKQLEYLADLVSITVKKGDYVALSGDLGAGKTTFARFLINNMADGLAEIPSPTFAIVQQYETRRLPISHFDFYRIADGSEALELGLEEAQDEGLVLGEWSAKLEEFLPNERLDIFFGEESGNPDLRIVTLSAYGLDWQQRLARLVAIDGFLKREGWHSAKITYLQGDASARSYARLNHDGFGKAILMNAPKMPDGPAIRDDGRTYSDLAHLAEDVAPFIWVGRALQLAGLRSPEILDYDLEQGFIILEDMGDDVYGALIHAGSDPEPLYRNAVEVLALLARQPVSATTPLNGSPDYCLPPCDTSVLSIEIELLTDWFYPAVTNRSIGADDLGQFEALWQPLLAQVAEDQHHWLLRDFHSPNLLALSGDSVAQKVGIIDFQDALAGNAAYDLVSLLQDARLDISQELEQDLFAYYCTLRQQADPDFDKPRFASDYAILGTQRNTKILGIFARLARRDNKPAYLVHIPRIAKYLERNLHHPDLAALKTWYDTHLPASQRVLQA